MLRGDVGYAAGYGGKPLPFYKVFYGGGVGSVRGYETATLGPRDLAGNPLGGERKIIGNAELFYPLLKGDKSVRASVFMDAGQISGVPGLGATGASLEKEQREVPVFVRRRARLELAGRAAQVQLCVAVEDEARRPDREFPVPGRIRVLGPSTQEKRLKRSIRRIAAALVVRGRIVLGSAPARRTPPTTRSASSTPSACFAKRRRRSARSRSSRRSSPRAMPKSRRCRSRCATSRPRSRRTASRCPRPTAATRSATSPISRATCSAAQREFREDLNLRRNEELASVQERANKVIQQIAEAEKFDLILQDPVVFASQKIDITDKVVKALADK